MEPIDKRLLPVLWVPKSVRKKPFEELIIGKSSSCKSGTGGNEVWCEGYSMHFCRYFKAAEDSTWGEIEGEWVFL